MGDAREVTDKIIVCHRLRAMGIAALLLYGADLPIPAGTKPGRDSFLDENPVRELRG